jgi:uroporphyrinogen-III decarboxylase
MTSRQRILAAMKLDKPDRVPVTPFGLGKLDPNGSMAQELIEKTDPILTVGAGGNAFVGQDVKTTVQKNGDATTTIYHTPKGDLTRIVRNTGITSATVQFPLNTPEDVEKFLSIPYVAPEVDAQAFHALKTKAGEEALVMVGIANAVCLPASWFSPEGFCLSWIDTPDLVLQLTAIAATRTNAYVEALCKAGVDAFRIIGGEYASVQLGPVGFDKLVMAFDPELAAIMHRYDAIAYYHNHGPVTQFLDRFADLGIDAIDPLEAPPWGDLDLAEAKRRIGNQVCLVGNLDDMEILEKCDLKTVQKMARECLEKAGPDGYLLAGTASGTYTEPAARNFIALVDVVKEYSRS